MAAQAQAARSALRRLIRAQRAAFKSDTEMQRTALSTIREQFRSNKDAPPHKMPGLLKQVDDAVAFLQNNVVQAPLNERGNYTVDASRIDESQSRKPNG